MRNVLLSPTKKRDMLLIFMIGHGYEGLGTLSTYKFFSWRPVHCSLVYCQPAFRQTHLSAVFVVASEAFRVLNGVSSVVSGERLLVICPFVLVSLSLFEMFCVSHSVLNHSPLCFTVASKNIHLRPVDNGVYKCLDPVELGFPLHLWTILPFLLFTELSQDGYLH